MQIPDPVARSWFEANTFRRSEIDPERVSELKRRTGTTVTACLPALDEAATIGRICSCIRADLMSDPRVVDELVVVDSGSTDGTVASATESGATVYAAADISGPHPGAAGKGGALWSSLRVVRGDVVVWLDSDLHNFDAGFVTSLLHPMLMHQSLVINKAFYERPIRSPAQPVERGARVTEIAVRPLLGMLFPTLSGLIQPLSGEYAVRRAAIERLPLFSGYGVDLGLVIDVEARYGIDAIAQTDLGLRVHANQDLHALGRMAHQVMQVILRRADEAGNVKLGDELPTSLTQFVETPDGVHASVHDLRVVELPPLVEG